LELLSSEVVEQVCLDVDALAVQDAPEVVPRRLVVGRPRLPLVHAAGHDDVEVLLAVDAKLAQELLVLRLEGVAELVEQAVDRRLRAAQAVLARRVAGGRLARRPPAGRDGQEAQRDRQSEASHLRLLSRRRRAGAMHTIAPALSQSVTSDGS